MKTTGSNYKNTSDLDLADVAKLVRKDIRRALPGYKFSVRISRYSGGQSLKAELRALPADVEILDCAENDPRWPDEEAFRVSGPMAEALSLAEGILNSYNRRDVDIQSDYWNVRFFADASASYELRREAFEARQLANELGALLDEVA